MIFSPQTIHAIEEVFGRPLIYSGDFEGLSLSIGERVGEAVSVNTLKRLFGCLKGSVEPRRSTLDILARYLGMPDWESYRQKMSGEGNSDFNTGDGVIGTAGLPVGSKVSFRYHPDREVSMVHLGDGVFRVPGSRNSKLREGDGVKAESLCLHYPLVVRSVVRNGAELGRFVAGKVGGLTEIKIQQYGEF